MPALFEGGAVFFPFMAVRRYGIRSSAFLPYKYSLLYVPIHRVNERLSRLDQEAPLGVFLSTNIPSSISFLETTRSKEYGSPYFTAALLSAPPSFFPPAASLGGLGNETMPIDTAPMGNRSLFLRAGVLYRRVRRYARKLRSMSLPRIFFVGLRTTSRFISRHTVLSAREKGRRSVNAFSSSVLSISASFISRTLSFRHAARECPRYLMFQELRYLYKPLWGGRHDAPARFLSSGRFTPVFPPPSCHLCKQSGRYLYVFNASASSKRR